MKTSELKKIVEENGLHFLEDELYYYADGGKDHDNNFARVQKKVVGSFTTLRNLPKPIAQAILEYAYTPLEEREEVKKYTCLNFEQPWIKYTFEKGEQEDIKTEYTLKELRELDFLKEIDGQWYMKLELEEVE